MAIFDMVVLSNSLRQWAVALVIGLVAWIILRVLFRLVRRVVGRLDAGETDWHHIALRALDRTKPILTPILALYAATIPLVLPPRVRDAVDALAVLTLLVQGGIWIGAALAMWLDRHTALAMVKDRSAATTLRALGFGLKLVLWTVVLLLALDNLGVNITALVAGLGVGGIAVALAVQNILGDLFASLSIVLDKPFVLGDFLIVDDLLGSVEHIGVKTTRLRSLWGEQLIFSNGDLLKARLRNYGRMSQRRVSFEIGVSYQTPRDSLKKIPGIIREAIEEAGQTRFDRSHLREYGEFALKFESVYYVGSPDYNVHMDVLQSINFRLHERFEEEGIQFAYRVQRTDRAPVLADASE